MLSFGAQLKVLSKRDMVILLNGYEHTVYDVLAGNSNMIALINSRTEVHVGSYIQSEEVYLTHNNELGGKESLVLRVGKFVEIPEEEFKVDEPLIIKCNGKLIKSENSKLKYVGPAKKPFVPCTIRVKNEEGEKFNILVVAFYKKAKILDQVADGTFVDLTARLFRKVYDDGFELNLCDFKIIESKKL